MIYRFANCSLDTGARRMTRDGSEVPVEPQVFDLLCLLAENAGRVVSKDELIAVVWGGRIVSEATVSARINAARNAVGDSGKAQAVIRTAPRRGFGMVAEVKVAEADAKQAPDGAATLKQTIRYTTSRDGTGIVYAVSGEGPPLLRAGHFLTHLDLDWEKSVFRHYIHALSASHRLVRYDMRGMGLSQAQVSELSLRAYAEDMLAVADAAGLDRFPIFALSQGVPIALYFAAHHPDRVSRLVLYGGFARGRLHRSDDGAANEAEALLTMIRSGWGKPGSPFIAAFNAIFCPEMRPRRSAPV